MVGPCPEDLPQVRCKGAPEVPWMWVATPPALHQARPIVSPVKGLTPSTHFSPSCPVSSEGLPFCRKQMMWRLITIAATLLAGARTILCVHQLPCKNWPCHAPAHCSHGGALLALSYATRDIKHATVGGTDHSRFGYGVLDGVSGRFSVAFVCANPSPGYCIR